MRREFAVMREAHLELPAEPVPAAIVGSRGPAWLRRALNAALRRLDAKVQPPPIPVKARRFVAPDGDFLSRLVKQQRDLLRIYNQEANTLYVGPDAWGDAAGELRNAARVMSFDTDMQIGGPRGLRICGVRVVLVPWMEGVLLVPNEESQ